MSQNISPLLHDVNKPTVLTATKHFNKFAYMRYGERLKLARGERTQEWLASEAKVSQSLIWQLENSQTAKGSQYTNRFARALGVSIDWLADEEGEMVLKEQQKPRDPRIEHVLKVMESLPPYAVDAGVREIDSLAELINQMPKPNGSHG